MILEELILKRALGMSDEDIAAKRGLGYAKSVPEARSPARGGRLSGRVPASPHPGGAGARGRGAGRDDAAQVHLLLPEGPDGSGVQSTELMKIYTRKGDDGTTSLWYGGRVAKTDARTEAYGSIDEADATLGAARSLCGPDDTELAADLLGLQRQLFVAGAELATAQEAAGRLEDGVSRVTDAMVEALEPTIDRYMDRVDLPPKFVIPGGTRLSAQLDVARATLRRAERRVVTLKEADGLASEAVLRFLNRASDLVFAMARFADLDDPELFEGRDKEASDG